LVAKRLQLLLFVQAAGILDDERLIEQEEVVKTFVANFKVATNKFALLPNKNRLN
jgi:hypothetical protein